MKTSKTNGLKCCSMQGISDLFLESVVEPCYDQHGSTTVVACSTKMSRSLVSDSSGDPSGRMRILSPHSSFHQISCSYAREQQRINDFSGFTIERAHCRIGRRGAARAQPCDASAARPLSSCLRTFVMSESDAGRSNEMFDTRLLAHPSACAVRARVRLDATLDRYATARLQIPVVRSRNGASNSFFGNIVIVKAANNATLVVFALFI
ncbi:hypothetical protein EVAR_49327_1 [Eumeta japonica]|uniref:Uncharacterized protein n=1 Tax=Eumeta variegata TaxID=151549 RepID=A0A4C1YB26_EUMVA|nr:hypothetical protein EVAR_49327_1 [Eumeta japonica]